MKRWVQTLGLDQLVQTLHSNNPANNQNLTNSSLAIWYLRFKLLHDHLNWTFPSTIARSSHWLGARWEPGPPNNHSLTPNVIQDHIQGHYPLSTWLEVLFEKRQLIWGSVQGLLNDDVFKSGKTHREYPTVRICYLTLCQQIYFLWDFIKQACKAHFT